jgi:hypothetical protein
VAANACMPRGFGWLAPSVVVILLLLSQQLSLSSPFAAPQTRVELRYSDFSWFSSAPPGPTMLGPSTWLVPVPGQARHDGKLAVDDAKSVQEFSIAGMSFTASFLTPKASSGKSASFSDELVVFAASDASAFHGFEFGIRASVADGCVYAYSQFPDSSGNVVFHEHRLFTNDQLPHSYVLSLMDDRVAFLVDGTLRAVENYPSAPPGEFYVIATAHRASAGWNSSDIGLAVSDLTIEAQPPWGLLQPLVPPMLTGV